MRAKAGGIAMAAIISTSSQAATTAALPFHIAFIDGRCRKCEAQMLGAVQFSDGNVVWTQGFTPPGAAGEGEWTLLNSRDGGRSWRELRKSWSHNVETRAFFETPRDGWIAVPNGPGAEPYYASTADGGRGWRPLHVASSFVVQILYRGNRRGAAFANDQYAKKSTFSVTFDGGRHWRSSRIGGSMWADAFAYSGPNTPVLAGCADGETVILSSPDGGRKWSRTTIPQVSPTPERGGCEAGVDGLAFRSGKPGFALVQRHSFPLTKMDGYASLWRSPDNGEHWTRVFFEGHPSDGPQSTWFTGPYMLTKRWGKLVACAASDTALRLLQNPALADLRGRLKRVPDRHPDQAPHCQRTLICSAGQRPLSTRCGH
jgi:hypothetical protein